MSKWVAVVMALPIQILGPDRHVEQRLGVGGREAGHGHIGRRRLHGQGRRLGGVAERQQGAQGLAQGHGTTTEIQGRHVVGVEEPTADLGTAVQHGHRLAGVETDQIAGHRFVGLASGRHGGPVGDQALEDGRRIGRHDLLAKDRRGHVAPLARLGGRGREGHGLFRDRQIVGVDHRAFGEAQLGLDGVRAQAGDAVGIGAVIADQAPGHLAAGLVAHPHGVALVERAFDGADPAASRLLPLARAAAAPASTDTQPCGASEPAIQAL
jgi:hypothetical protein